MQCPLVAQMNSDQDLGFHKFSIPQNTNYLFSTTLPSSQNMVKWLKNNLYSEILRSLSNELHECTGQFPRGLNYERRQNMFSQSNFVLKFSFQITKRLGRRVRLE